ncbi:Coenzyme Q-binding protein COQ10-like protein [Smittium culicis]|uniref:Coenzyme Q-binding protein COQ10-like protein n=1 Tax=Smittium culicis TaxID=133412 RepID=A0A1R1YC51_9FUNG|nr:Coenzyme Q-binding protein COQ10-like protein [Smittium culicis]
MGNNKKTYTETLELGYSQVELFNVVSNVDEYKNFIPFCVDSKVFAETKKVHFENLGKLDLASGKGDEIEEFVAELAVGFKGLNERYNSVVRCVGNKKVTAVSNNTKIFKQLTTVWTFTPVVNSNLVDTGNVKVQASEDARGADELNENGSKSAVSGEQGVNSTVNAGSDPSVVLSEGGGDASNAANISFLPVNPVIERKKAKAGSSGIVTSNTNDSIETVNAHDVNMTQVKFEIEFEFNNFLYSYFSNLFFDQVCKQMVSAFIGRCKHLYG